MTRLNPQIAEEFQQIDECSRAAQAWKSLADTSHSLQLINRYEAGLHRRYLRALRTLGQLQAARQPAQPQPEIKNSETNPTAPPATPPQPPIDAKQVPPRKPAATGANPTLRPPTK